MFYFQGYCYSIWLVNSYASQDAAWCHWLSINYPFIEVSLLTPVGNAHKQINYTCLINQIIKLISHSVIMCYM